MILDKSHKEIGCLVSYHYNCIAGYIIGLGYCKLNDLIGKLHKDISKLDIVVKRSDELILNGELTINYTT